MPYERKQVRQSEEVPSLNNLNFFSSKTSWKNIENELGEIKWEECMAQKDPVEQFQIL